MVTSAIKELVQRAPSGDKILSMCEEVESVCLATYFPNGNSTESWVPVNIFKEDDVENHLRTVVNHSLSKVQSWSTIEKFNTSPEFFVTLTTLVSDLVALSIVVGGNNLTGDKIQTKMETMVELLLLKNVSYQNSALNPVSIFGNLDAKDQLYARLNDKLNRIKNNEAYESEGFKDAVDDLVGYLILLLLYFKTKETQQ